MRKKITELPSRFEPLSSILGEDVKTTFIKQQTDLDEIKRLLARIDSSNQSKLMFVYGESGTGKTTFIHSLELFLGDKVDRVITLPPEHELSLVDTPAWIAKAKASDRITVFNFDAREAPNFDEASYKTFLVQLNSILKTRKDILILWPINDRSYGERVVALLQKVGGRSPFGKNEVFELKGLGSDQYIDCLVKILQVANWRLEDAAIGWDELQELVENNRTVGSFLDDVQNLITERYDIDDLGVSLPKIVFVLSSNKLDIREICRGLRRADSYYIESSRLTMYTDRSNVAEWWRERSKDLRTSLPYIVSLFDAQLIAVSGASVVHSVLHFGDDAIKNLVQGVTANIGNAKRVMQSSELYKYSLGEDVDNREYGMNPKNETLESYRRIQETSKLNHKKINSAILELLKVSDGGFGSWAYEQSLASGLQTDVVVKETDPELCLEFHHKAGGECTYNKVSIYILEKLKEYAINFGLVKR